MWLGVGGEAGRRELQSGGRRRERKNKKRHEVPLGARMVGAVASCTVKGPGTPAQEEESSL